MKCENPLCARCNKPPVNPYTGKPFAVCREIDPNGAFEPHPGYEEIKTAPDEGRILLFAGGEWTIGQWNKHRTLWTTDDGYALLPTHWAPLPADPSA